MLILDEPTAGVDVELRSSLWKYIRKINKQGTSICLTTHYLQEAEELCENITIINEGKIIKDDNKENLLNFISTKKVSFDLLNTFEIPSKLFQFNPNVNNKKLHLTYDKSKVSINNIIKILDESNIAFSEMNTYESNLEDVFKKLIINDANN